MPTNGIPDKIGSYPINDPEGLYRGQALAGYGLMWNTRYMQAQQAAGAEGMGRPRRSRSTSATSPTSSPSRSGTTHLTFETILQGEGWDKGWNQILQIAGNCAAITERSFGVPDGVQNGQFGIGLVIDFFGLAAKASGFPVEFAYPSMTAIVPANIAAVAGAKSPEGAQALHAVHAFRGRPAAAARPEDLAPAGAAGDLRQGARGLSESVQRHDPGQGQFRLRPVRVALLRGLVAVRPGHHLPPQGAAGGDQGDPGRREAARRPRQPAARGSEEARLDAAAERRAGARTRSCSPSSRRRRATTPRCARRPRSRRSGAARPRPTTPAPSSSPPPPNDPRRGRAGDRGLPRASSWSSPVASVFYAAFASGAGGFTLAHFETLLPDLADARVVLEQPLRRRPVGRCSPR